MVRVRWRWMAKLVRLFMDGWTGAPHQIINGGRMIIQPRDGQPSNFCWKQSWVVKKVWKRDPSPDC